jgi:hypothetical protein
MSGRLFLEEMPRRLERGFGCARRKKEDQTVRRRLGGELLRRSMDL